MNKLDDAGLLVFVVFSCGVDIEFDAALNVCIMVAVAAAAVADAPVAWGGTVDKTAAPVLATHATAAAIVDEAFGILSLLGVLFARLELLLFEGINMF